MFTIWYFWNRYEKKSGLHIKRHTDFKVGFLLFCFCPLLVVLFVKDWYDTVAIWTQRRKVALKTESAESQLPWSFRVCKVYVCVIFIHIYVQKIKKNRHNCVVPSEELILCKLNPDIIIHQSIHCLVGLPKRGFKISKQAEYCGKNQK